MHVPSLCNVPHPGVFDLLCDGGTHPAPFHLIQLEIHKVSIYLSIYIVLHESSMKLLIISI